MVHTRVKICGITRPEDARSAAECGADAIGLVFYPPSPRAVSVEQASEIISSLPPFITSVALFVDESADEIHRVLSRVPVDMIQFHGDESAAFCARFGRPWIKALRVRPDTDIRALANRYVDARAILLDAWQEGVPGGTGRRFDWALVPASLSRPLVLAGGLDPDNVGEAVSTLWPAAVDVSGGVESSPGVKDTVKIGRFVAAVRAAEVRSGSRKNDR